MSHLDWSDRRGCGVSRGGSKGLHLVGPAQAPGGRVRRKTVHPAWLQRKERKSSSGLVVHAMAVISPAHSFAWGGFGLQHTLRRPDARPPAHARTSPANTQAIRFAYRHPSLLHKGWAFAGWDPPSQSESTPLLLRTPPVMDPNAWEQCGHMTICDSHQPAVSLQRQQSGSTSEAAVLQRLALANLGGC